MDEAKREVANPRIFNPCPDSIGMVMYEHWETTATGSHYLVKVSSSPISMRLQPGDWILTRRWGPAGEPFLYNRAREESR